jgi:serine/threonine protein kinase
MNNAGIATLNMEKSINFIGTLWYMPPEHLYAIFTKSESRFDGRVSFRIYLFPILKYYYF